MVVGQGEFKRKYVIEYILGYSLWGCQKAPFKK